MNQTVSGLKGGAWLLTEPPMLRSYADRIASGTVVLSREEQARIVFLLADYRERIAYLETHVSVEVAS